MYACIYVISATSSPSSKGDVPSVTESKDTKSVNLDGGRCSRLEYLPEGIANQWRSYTRALARASTYLALASKTDKNHMIIY